MIRRARTCPSRKVLLFALGYIILCAFVHRCRWIWGANHGDVVRQIVSNNMTKGHMLLKRNIKILYWNKFFKSNEFKFGLGQEPFLKNDCPVNTCTTSNNKSTLSAADVVIFHGPQIEELPEVRPNRQLYVYVQKEPWMDMSAKLMPRFSDMMNVTMTYRTDSDIQLPYAIVEKNATYYDKHPVYVDPRKRKSSVAWVVSHCETLSQRERYVNELKKHINVDVYGECGDLSCDKRQNGACWAMFERKYNFIIALENDHCKDYVSEKVYRPFGYNLIPVVYGGANYSQVTPPHSLINIKDYKNPKALAQYLTGLSRSPNAYNQYFAWKSQGYTLETYRRTIIARAFCRLCEVLHDPDYHYSRYPDLTKWWTDGTCQRDFIEEVIK